MNEAGHGKKKGDTMREMRKSATEEDTQAQKAVTENSPTGNTTQRRRSSGEGEKPKATAGHKMHLSATATTRGSSSTLPVSRKLLGTFLALLCLTASGALYAGMQHTGSESVTEFAQELTAVTMDWGRSMKAAFRSQVDRLGEDEDDERIDAPPQRARSFTGQGEEGEMDTAPPSTGKEKKVKNTLGSNEKGEGKQEPTLHCYTLTQYSDIFLASQKDKRAQQHWWGCGTRVIDLRTETRPRYVEACGGVSDSSGAAAYALMRVVLTEEEVGWHRQQRMNAAAQRIPLSQFNDDYCDCLDGTDELLTNACSMSGASMILAGLRWKQYLVANQHIQLYEDQSIRKGSSARRLYNTTVVPLLFSSGGPVLPFRCEKDSAALLPPSMVGDGIVDCSDGSDEGTMPGHPYLLLNNNDAAAASASTAQESEERENKKRSAAEVFLGTFYAAERAQARKRWIERRERVAQALAAAAGKGATRVSAHTAPLDRLYGHLPTLTSLLVDKGYLSLFTTHDVKETRLSSAKALYEMYRKGYRTQQVRSAKGWERLGRHLVSNHSQMALHLANVTDEITRRQQVIRRLLQQKGTNDLQAAGVVPEDLHALDALSAAYGSLRQEMTYINIISTQHVFGDHYEYYPLFARHMSVARGDIIDAVSAYGTSEWMQEERQERVMSFSQMREAGIGSGAPNTLSPADLHIDNVTFAWYGAVMARAMLGAQHHSESESEAIATTMRLIPEGGTYSPDILNSISDPFKKSPVFLLSHWQPFATRENDPSMTIADPTGGAELTRRAAVKRASAFVRGGGNTQWPHRIPDPHRLLVKREKGEAREQESKTRLEAAMKGEEDKKVEFVVPHHHHMPNVLSSHWFASGLRCEFDRPLRWRWNWMDDGDNSTGTATDAYDEPHFELFDAKRRRSTEGSVLYVCDTKDSVLVWARNGKCMHEVVVGTPSACTQWALKESQSRMERARKDLIME